MFKKFIYTFPSRFGLFIEEEGKGEGAGGDNVDDAIKKAADKLEKKSDDKKVDDKKVDDKKKDELTDEEIEELEQGRNLIRLLKDPTTRKALILSLAEKEGIDADSSKKEKKEAAKTIKSILKSHLGEEYEILSGKLENIFTEFADLFENERVKPIKDGLTKKDLDSSREAASVAYDEVFAQYSNSKELESEVTKLTKEIQVGPGVTPKVYFQRLIKLAAEEKGVALIKVSAKKESVLNFDANKRNLNRKDVNSRLTSEGADIDDTNVIKAPKPMSLDEAIKAAAAKVDASFKK